MRIDDVESLVELVAQANVTEVIVEKGERRVTIRRFGSGRASPVEPCARGKEGRPAETAPPAPTPDASERRSTHVIGAPMVGVFRATEPPVRVGSRVRPGQVVGAIESMKLMNDVRAEEGGVVTEAFVEDGAPVDYGHPLFSLEPDTLEQG